MMEMMEGRKVWRLKSRAAVPANLMEKRAMKRKREKVSKF